ncbi:hypothetical protein J0B03_00105 [Alkalibacter rhizosphaerae]|uniref:ATP synthase F1 complex delta/epsilon subunit N-terminal domain-containing protein n=1 Tax=Alkalibacter rhizosphaerae TaxID=2815577 RepID=A0A974XES9_9FIRM|nr:hypothetical protein [Alkalibacter rhizosphaerae]QSX08532.1 hypothetical protein J0B03_00105 [Alkalibacter rhizosphaerae]
MELDIILPNKTMEFLEIEALTAPGTEGSFQIYPKHVDFTSTLKAGILTIKKEKEEIYIAINNGVLVKKGEKIHVACHQAIQGESLEKLSTTVEETFLAANEREKSTNEILAKMEIETLKRFFELE